MGEIRWTEKSSKNLEAIFEYISNDSKLYAIQFVKSLIKSIQILESQPLIGRIVPEINEKTIREIFYKNYRIVYKVVDSDIVEIITIYHGAMDFTSFKIEE